MNHLGTLLPLFYCGLGRNSSQYLFSIRSVITAAAVSGLRDDVVRLHYPETPSLRRQTARGIRPLRNVVLKVVYICWASRLRNTM